MRFMWLEKRRQGLVEALVVADVGPDRRPTPAARSRVPRARAQSELVEQAEQPDGLEARRSCRPCWVPTRSSTAVSSRQPHVDGDGRRAQ